MPQVGKFSRRKFLRSMAAASAGMALTGCRSPGKLAANPALRPLAPFDYGDVSLASELHETQLDQTHRVLMGLSDDSLLKPFRQMSGQPAPGEDLGGWYNYHPDFSWERDKGSGFAPSCHFGQWVSALARSYAIRPDPATRDKVLQLNRLYARTISGEYYERNRFPTYCYDKLVRGLMDSHKYVGDPDALAILEHTTDTALPHFPKQAVEHGVDWRHKNDANWTWDESYTISENLFLAYHGGAGACYRELGRQYLDDAFYNPLAEGRNVLGGRHAYSHVNSLGSAVQAYLSLGSEKHLRAAKNGFDMLRRQSFATGGWGPNETLSGPGGSALYDSLSGTHASFETPCGAYAHFKLTRNLLRVTRDPQYGDSMERMMYNTVLGAKPLQADGRTFYYSDYNFKGRKVYDPTQHWSCCAGTLPLVATDYRINTYLRDEQGVYVNLYLPSTLRWRQAGADVRLTQVSRYPFESVVRFTVNNSQASDFALKFRIPSWAGNAKISVNGRRLAAETAPGTFATVRRQWSDGDLVELDLPATTRLESVDPDHPQTVALLHGPLVLFAITDNPPALTRANLLAAQRVGARTWRVQTGSGPLELRPFTEITDEPYATYLQVA